MKKISLGLVVVLLLVAFAGIISQHGKATTITWLSIVPLLGYLVLWGIGTLRS